MFKPQLFSSYVTCLHTRQTEFFLHHCCLLPLLPFIAHGKQSNECTWRRMALPLHNLYKCKQVGCSVVVACFIYQLFFILHCVVACLLLNPRMLLLLVYFFIPFFYTDVVAIFCLFVDHVNKFFHYFCFGAFVYHFKNSISIFVTIHT